MKANIMLYFLLATTPLEEGELIPITQFLFQIKKEKEKKNFAGDFFGEGAPPVLI